MGWGLRPYPDWLRTAPASTTGRNGRGRRVGRDPVQKQTTEIGRRNGDLAARVSGVAERGRAGRMSGSGIATKSLKMQAETGSCCIALRMIAQK